MDKRHRNSFLAITILLVTLISGCSWIKSKFSSKPERVVNLYIWGLYTTPDMKREFKEKTGITVVESNYGSNEELLAKLQAGADGYDLVVPSDYMVTALNNLGLLNPLDHSKLPNLSNVDKKFLNQKFDPENKVSVPYAWSITGIAVNRTLFTDQVVSWGDLLTNETLNGRFAILDDVREAMAAALKIQGASINSIDPEVIAKAQAVLLDAKKRVRAFNSTPGLMLGSGDIVAAQMYSGEALMLARETQKPIEFIVPREGSAYSIDNLVIPRGAKHVEEAYALINFFYEKKVNAEFVARTGSGPVIVGVQELLPEPLRHSPSLFPSEAALKNCEMMQDLGPAMALYDKLWTSLKAM